MSIGDVNSNARGSGARYNDGKVAFDLIPGIALEDCARVFDYGRKKYAAWNWAKGMQWMVVFGCLLRHLYAWARGEDNDPESGLPHLGHAMCNLVMLTTFARTYPEGDDRPKGLFGAPAGRTARRLDEASAIAAAQDGTPAESAYLLKNGSRIATPAEVDGLREVLTAEELKGFGIGDVEPRDVAETATTVATSQHPMAAEALRDHDERLSGPEDHL